MRELARERRRQETVDHEQVIAQMLGGFPQWREGKSQVADTWFILAE
jgi:hypothetical protein